MTQADMSAKEARGMLGIPASTFRKMAVRGDIPGSYQFGDRGQWRVRTPIFLDWFNQLPVKAAQT